MGTVVVLAAQVGGAKLADGLYRLRGMDLAVVVNTGDDYRHLGLAFSPDLDTTLFTLAGIASATAGWEPEGETRALQGMLKQLGGPDRPLLGDKSLAAPLLRAEGLANERRLTEITLDFCRRLGIEALVLPMSDDPVRTNVLTDDGAMTFQARISDEVLDALHSEDLEAVVIGPANPYHGIRPILELNGMRELLRRRGAPVVAVTPVVGGKALQGSAGKMMRELGREPTALGAATEYRSLADGFVIDREDLAFAEGVRSLGMRVLAVHTVMRTPEDRVALARSVLEFARSIREARALEVE
ncbi:MAG: 2-phospho-L-lactate transferase [Betaproteobacteria bacterium]|nr:MAG: 2-phospho-L-lactate transferase [Betaproteobacteria bacterium]